MRTTTLILLFLCLLVFVMLLGCGTKKSRPVTNPIDGAFLCRVNPGTFTMGDVNIGQCAHQVTLTKSFFIYKYPVTVAQYRAFVKANPHKKTMPNQPSWGWNDTHPMVNVSWQDAMDYARWAGAGLPTEAQWEFAARGAQGNSWPWGNAWDAKMCANSVGNAKLKGTQSVGSYPAGASWCGAEDISGNVWQWCADWYGDYPKDKQTDPTGARNGIARALRGGAWNGKTVDLYRGAARLNGLPNYANDTFGFRCVIAIP